MLNDLKIDKGIAYINDIPYIVGPSLHDIVRVGDRGEKVDYAVFPEDDGVHKVSNGSYFLKRLGQNNFDLITEGIVGGIYCGIDWFFVFRPEGTTQNILGSSSSYEETPIEGINGIKNVYNIVPKRYCILEDNDGKLVLWSSMSPSKVIADYKGSHIKLHTFDTRSVRFGQEDVVFLTDEALYYGKPADGFDLISLPNGVTPDDIKDFQVIAENNIFFLTNDGRVYARGKNGYNQRGTTKKLKLEEWNQIEYPEPIKQIAASSVPGLFALSEDGNLYYHGYNEGSYYPITDRKSNISKPMKILDNVSSLWMIKDFGRGGMKNFKTSNMFLFLDNDGILKKLINSSSRDSNVELLKQHSVILPSEIYRKLVPGLVMNKEMLSAFIRHECL